MPYPARIYCSLDGGKSWSLNKNLEEKGRCPVLEVFLTGRIVCFYLLEYTDSNNRTKYKIRYIYSDDDGKTWSEARDLIDDVLYGGIGVCSDLTGKIFITYWQEYVDTEVQYLQEISYDFEKIGTPVRIF